MSGHSLVPPAVGKASLSDADQLLLGVRHKDASGGGDENILFQADLPVLVSANVEFDCEDVSLLDCSLGAFAEQLPQRRQAGAAIVGELTDLMSQSVLEFLVTVSKDDVTCHCVDLVAKAAGTDEPGGFDDGLAYCVERTLDVFGDRVR